MEGILIKIVIGIMLLVSGIQDIKRKKVFLWVIIISTVLISVCVPIYSTLSIPDIIGGFAVGAMVIIISLATGGKIGLGDGLLLCATGIGLGFWGNLELFAIALFLAAVVSIVLLILRLADRKKSIPFVPFLLIGYVVMLFADLRVKY